MRRCLRLPGVLALLLGGVECLSAQDAPPIVVADTAAIHHVGEVVTVEGPIANVHVGAHRKTTFLNFRFRYPDHSFSAWIPDSVVGAFPGLATLEGRVVRVTGKVWMQDDKWPAITLLRPQDLEELPGEATTR